ncbi:MAG: DUF2163 domain-containing protein [Methylobacter sp.]|nr:MAG: DUF2163 domain-containing protein [Methylobacter sp.]
MPGCRIHRLSEERGMKTAHPGIPELAVGVICETYRITLSNGTALYYTTGDVDINYYGQTFLAGELIFDRGPIRTVVGVEVDDVAVTVYPGINGNSILSPEFVNNGGLDLAWLTIFRVRQNYGVCLFDGLISDATADRSKAELIASAGTLLLNIDMPRNVYTAGCIHTLFDSGCGLIKANFANPSAVLSGSTHRVLLCGLTQALGYFDLGTVTFTSGANNGVTRTISYSDIGNIRLSYPLKNAPEVGDTFIAYPGCDKRMAETCAGKFSNLPRYRGFPFIPVPEATI